MLDQLVLELLLQVNASVADLRNTVDGVDHEMKAVQLVQHRHVEGRRDVEIVFFDDPVQVDVNEVLPGWCPNAPGPCQKGRTGFPSLP
jgi:hypothetical protein